MRMKTQTKEITKHTTQPKQNDRRRRKERGDEGEKCMMGLSSL
jgi:hypothetical protein